MQRDWAEFDEAGVPARSWVHARPLAPCIFGNMLNSFRTFVREVTLVITRVAVGKDACGTGLAGPSR